jgi:hypothetical protein
MRFDYVSDEDLTEVSELFYSDGKDWEYIKHQKWAETHFWCISVF